MGLISRVSSRTYRYLNPPFSNSKNLQKWPKELSTTNPTPKSETKNSSGTTMPSIGFGTAKTTRHCCRDQLGFKKFLVHNLEELNCLMMSNRKFACEIAKGVASKKRKAIIERAAALNVHVTNKKSKLRSEENE